MRTPLLLCLLLIVSVLSAQSQNVTITPNGITPASSHPRLTYDAILALPNPADGDIAYDITFKCLRVFNGSKWVCTLTNNPDILPNIAAIALIGGSNSDFARSVAVDADGNVYVTGGYSGTTNFGSISLTSVGSEDVFIAKYNGSGSLQWVKSAGGANAEGCRSIGVDGSGNVYITGSYIGTTTFGNTSFTSAGNNDIFIAKYDTNGNPLWARSAGGSMIDDSKCIAVDAAGNAFITGIIRGAVTFESTPITSVGGDDIFWAKYDTNGNLQWVRSAGSNGDDQGLGIDTDADGNMYATGAYLETVTFGSTPLTSAGGYDVFLIRYNSNGDFQWVRSAGGTSHEYGQSIAVGSSNTLVITGGFQGTSSPAMFEGTPIISAGNMDIFIAKYNIFGSFIWVRSAGGTAYDIAYGVATDASDNIYITGIYAGTAKFGTAAVNVSKTAVGLFDIYVAKYAPDGTFKWIQSAGGTNDDAGLSIAVAPGNNVYFVGIYAYSALFGNITLTSSGGTDSFIGRVEK